MIMKDAILRIKQGLAVAILLIFGTSLSGQNSDQARTFIGRSHVAIMKVEKEMYRAGDNANAAELKKALKYQMIAINLYKQNKLKEAVAYSFKSRSICMEVCNKMGIAEGSHYNLNDEEKTFCNPAPNADLTIQSGLLSKEQTKEIDEVDVLDVQKFHKLELSIQ
jgi:hypothetical protein